MLNKKNLVITILLLLSVTSCDNSLNNSENKLSVGDDKKVINTMDNNNNKKLIENNGESVKEKKPLTIRKEKSRDSLRILDLSKIKTALNLFYYKYGEFPTNLEELGNILPIIPHDSKKGEIINGCTFGYKYKTLDENGIDNMKFELSTCLENSDKKIYIINS